MSTILKFELNHGRKKYQQKPSVAQTFQQVTTNMIMIKMDAKAVRFARPHPVPAMVWWQSTLFINNLVLVR